mgnify:CR=1 FL=1
MKYRNLGPKGSGGLKVSAIGVGCMPMIKGGNILYGEAADPDEAIKTIHRAIDLGITFFDTAQIYGPFQNEELVGEAIKGKRDGLYWPTKAGEPPSPLGALVVQAAGEGYKAKQGEPTPYHGYYYRLLTGQSKSAEGGALDYVVRGRAIGGFAAIARAFCRYFSDSSSLPR